MKIVARKTAKKIAEKAFTPFEYRYRGARIREGKIIFTIGDSSCPNANMRIRDGDFVIDLGPGLDLSSDDDQ